MSGSELRKQWEEITTTLTKRLSTLQCHVTEEDNEKGTLGKERVLCDEEFNAADHHWWEHWQRVSAVHSQWRVQCHTTQISLAWCSRSSCLHEYSWRRRRGETLTGGAGVKWCQRCTSVVLCDWFKRLSRLKSTISSNMQQFKMVYLMKYRCLLKIFIYHVW